MIEPSAAAEVPISKATPVQLGVVISLGVIIIASIVAHVRLEGRVEQHASAIAELRAEERVSLDERKRLSEQVGRHGDAFVRIMEVLTEVKTDLKALRDERRK